MYARDLYAVLHAIDEGDFDAVVIERAPESAECWAVRDRVARAAQP
jgi:hypothetical protein